MAPKASTPSYENMPEIHKPFPESVRSMFTNPQFSDLTIICGKQRWFVNKVIVCYRSPWFAKACHGDWKKKDNQPVDLSEDDPEAVQGMLRYLYTFKYSYTDTVRALDDLKVHTLADNYEIPELMKVCEARFAENVTHDWKLEEFGSVFEELYTRALDRDGKLTASLLDVIVEHALELYEPVKEPFGGEFRRLVRTNARFASDINARLIFKTQQGSACLECKDCRNTWPHKMVRGKCVCAECGSEGHLLQ